MKILVLISNFIEHSLIKRTFSANWQVDVVNRQINEFKTYKKYDLDIKRFTTPEGASYKIDGVDTIIYPQELNVAFPYTTKAWTVENKSLLSEYDYVLFTEDDLLIKEEKFDNVIRYQNIFNQVNPNYKAGFIRFEMKPNGEKQYIDQHPAYPTVRHVLTINDETFFQPENIHSGCWIFSSDDILHMIDNNTYQTSPFNLGRQYHGALESAASEIYFDYTKLFPADVEQVEIEHMCNKYTGLTKEGILRLIGAQQ